jgi:hypothetical protein
MAHPSEGGHFGKIIRVREFPNWKKIPIGLVVIVLFASAIAVPLAVKWADQRTQMHVNWVNQAREAAAFNRATRSLADLLASPNWPDNGTSTIAPSIMSLAATSMYNLEYLDWNHATQLSIIEETLNRLGTVWSGYVVSLTASQRTTFSEEVRSMGGDVAGAYANFYQTSTPINTGTGPPFWYNGPSPPDEALLQRAVTLASLPGLPTLSYG